MTDIYRFIGYFAINIILYSIVLYDLFNDYDRESDRETASYMSIIITIGFTVYAIITTVKNAINGTQTEIYFSVAMLVQSLTELIIVSIIKKKAGR